MPRKKKSIPDHALLRHFVYVNVKGEHHIFTDTSAEARAKSRETAREQGLNYRQSFKDFYEVTL